MISFNERLNTATLVGNFSLTNLTTMQSVGGNAAFFNDDSLIAFTPQSELSFGTTYELRLEPGLQDLFGNGLPDTFITHFDTEVEPLVSISSLSPSKGVIGMIISLNGKGFDPEPGNNTVSFNGTSAVVSDASPTQLMVTVPEGATSGPVTVYNHTQGETSNDLQFTVLTTDEVPKGFESVICALSGIPWDLAVLPGGDYVFVATDAGAEVVITDPASPDYMTATTIPITGGLTHIAASPAGNTVYAVSSITEKYYRLSSVPGSMGLLSEKPIGAVPRGIAIHPKGNRAFIPTEDGDIQIWDIEESNPSFESPVGHVPNADPNIRGRLASSPSGNILLGLAGTGHLVVADMDSNKIINSVTLLSDPEDIAIDPLGNLAYVCDETGYVNIVSMTDFASPWKIRTGGALQGIDITPAGSFALTVDREHNLMSAIDLRDTSPSYLSVVVTVQLPTNPVAIKLSHDGDYAFTISEAEKSLVSTTLGLGPALKTLSRVAGPVGARLVMRGSGFDPDTTTVYFGSLEAEPERLDESRLTVVVPPGASSGEVSVGIIGEEANDYQSNSIYFRIIGEEANDILRLARACAGEPSPAIDGGSVLQMYPGGNFVALADKSGGVHILNNDARSAAFGQFAGSFGLGSNASDVVITPDRLRSFIVLPDSGTVLVLGADPLRTDFLSPITSIDFSGISGSSIARAAMSPDGMELLVSDPGASQVHFVDIAPDSPTEYDIAASVTVSAGAVNGEAYEMAYHPGGAYAYLAINDSDPAVIVVVDTAAESPTYRTVVYTAALPGSVPQEVPVSLSFTPDGDRCLILTSQYISSPNRTALMLNSSSPAAPYVSTSLSLGGTAAPVDEHIDVSPMGVRAIAGVRGIGLINLEIQTDPDTLIETQTIGRASHHLTTVDGDFAQDGSAFFCLSESSDTLLTYDFTDAGTIAVYSGNAQSGVVNEALPEPIRVEVTGTGGPVEDVPVTFTVNTGGGYFEANDSTLQTVATDADGIAEVDWVLGPDVGAGAQTAQAMAIGLTGSPCAFSADGLVDPNTLPLTVTGVTPDSGATGVSISTSIQVAFSRAVDCSTVTKASLRLHDGDMYPLPSTIGFADDNRIASITPLSTLQPLGTYWVEVMSDIQDAAGGPLDQAVSASFQIEAAPPIQLRSIKPASGPLGQEIILSGNGFNSNLASNKVFFGADEVAPEDGDRDFLSVKVPWDAVSCSVRVLNSSMPMDTSNAITFAVLDAVADPVNNVVGSVSTSSAVRSVAITPDGGTAYAVSSDGDRVIVIDLVNVIQIGSISVGENPVAVNVDPAGEYAYVANYIDGTVTVIDARGGSPTQNQVVDAFSVGVGPTDLAVTPDGSRLVVANSVSSGISFVDIESGSETYRSVVSTLSTGQGSRTVAITPDGGTIYVGTDYGYTVVSATQGVVSTISSGAGARTVSITPDGGILVFLSTEGDIFFYDIQENSTTENQVVGSLKTSSGTSSFAISPDGGSIYLIQESGDQIFIGIFTIHTSQGGLADGVAIPTDAVEITLVDTLVAGEDPTAIAFFPTGSGEFVVTNPGEYKVTIMGPPSGGITPVDQVRQIRNYPNPFMGFTTIKFAIPEPMHVQMAVYDVRGRLVAEIIDSRMEAGVHTAQWNGTDRHGARVASGLYFCRLIAGEQVRTRKMMLLR